MTRQAGPGASVPWFAPSQSQTMDQLVHDSVALRHVLQTLLAGDDAGVRAAAVLGSTSTAWRHAVRDAYFPLVTVGPSIQAFASFTAWLRTQNDGHPIGW